MPRPLSPVSLVFVALLVTGAASAETDANSVASQLAIASDSFCPSADAVREALLGLRPAEEWPSTTVAIHAQEQLLSVELGSLDSIQRQLAVGPDCAARATTVALVIATWMNDLPAEVAGTPILRSPIILAPELPMPKPAIARYELGAGLLAALNGGITPGVRMEFLRLPGDRGVGWQASLVLPAAREVALGGGVTRWTRVAASVALNAVLARKKFFISGDGGLAGAYTLAWGQGYAVNQTDQSFTYGLVAGVRAGIPWGRLRLWTDLRAAKWLYDQSVQIDSDFGGPVTRISLPTWDAQWAMGLSYALR